MTTIVYEGNSADPVDLAPIDPDFDEQDYQVNWSGWLNGDTISASTWIVPSEFSQPQTATNTATTTTVWLKADTGRRGRKYEIENRITTAAGRKQSRTFRVLVADR